MLQLQRSNIDSRADASWVLAEKLTRPDGSLAESMFLLVDGTRLHSMFAGTSADHLISRRGALSVRMEKREGVIRTYLGDSVEPVWETTISTGPSGIQVRQFRTLPLPLPIVPPITLGPGKEPERIDDAREGYAVIQPAAVISLALQQLFNMVSAELPSFGGGIADVPTLVYRAWAKGDGKIAGATAVATLTPTQVSLLCPRLGEVQEILDLAAAELAPLKSTVSAAAWGSMVHRRAKEILDGRKALFSEAYAGIFAEISLDIESKVVTYGTEKSTRLDVLDIAEQGTTCVYDAKTGKAGLTANRIAQIATIVQNYVPGSTFVIMELRPGDILGIE